jgi:glycerol-3-phosphate dehydrogenase
LHIDDVLTRRTHIAFEASDRGQAAAVDVARLMAPVLAWDEHAVDREIAHYAARLQAEAAAQALLTDAASDTVRAEVRDPRLEHFSAGESH